MTILASSVVRDLQTIAEAAAKYPGAVVRLEPRGIVVEVSRVIDGKTARGEQIVSWQEILSLVNVPAAVISRLQFLHAAVQQMTTPARRAP